MRVIDIYNILDSVSPFELQAKWDNSGLNIGSFNDVFENIYVALEIDSNVLESIKPKSLVIVHHPIIFKPIITFHTDLYPCNLISICMKKNIYVIALHTNFDKTHLNDAFAKSLCLEKLGYRYDREKDFSIIYAKNSESNLTHLTPSLLAKHLKDILNLSILRYSNACNIINEIYITCGSNASSHFIAKHGDCVITGDIKYHDAMIAKSNNISFIDIPHFESEYIFADLIAKILQKHNIQAIISNSHNPFHYV